MSAASTSAASCCERCFSGAAGTRGTLAQTSAADSAGFSCASSASRQSSDVQPSSSAARVPDAGTVGGIGRFDGTVGSIGRFVRVA